VTIPVAVFRSRVIADPRHTVGPDANSHFVLFPSFSWYITSWAMGDIRHMAIVGRHLEVDATGRDRAYGWLLVGYRVSGVSRPGRVGHSNPQRPSTGSI
jgi:hypothetical protein